MANTALKKVSVQMRLNNGTDSQGNVKTVSLNIGTLSTSGYNADKALAISQLISPCLAKSLVSVDEVKVSTITAA